MSHFADLDYDPRDDGFDSWGPSERASVSRRTAQARPPIRTQPITTNHPSLFGRSGEVVNVTHSSDSYSSVTTSISDSESESSLSQHSQHSHVSPIQSSRARDRPSDLELENAKLKQLVEALRGEANELRMQTSSLKGEIAGVNTAYERLLAKVISGTSSQAQPSYFQPFFRILQLAREANARLLECKRGDYVGQYYWTEDSFLDERQNGFFTATRNSQSGPLPFLIGENGIIVSNRYQEQMARFGSILFNTLRKYGMAPDTWEEVDVYALEWFCLSIRVRFVEFRLCNNHWKAETFASMGYPGWYNPRNPAPSHVVQEDENLATDFRATRQRMRKTNSKVRQESPQCQQSSLADPELDSSVSSRAREESLESGDDSACNDDFPPVFYDRDMNGFVEVLPHRIRFSSNPAWRSTRSERAVCIRGEDPPDYVALKLEERSRVDAFSRALGRQRQKLEILQGDPAWRAKPRAKEKKLCRTYERRSIENAIAEQLHDLENEKAEERDCERNPTGNESWFSPRHLSDIGKEEELISRLRADAQARAARQQQEQWECLPEVRQRLSSFVKYVDHVERAYRKEERLLLAGDNVRQQASDRAAFLAAQNVRIDRIRVGYNEKLATRERLLRMLPQFALYHSMIMKQRMNHFRTKQAIAAKLIEEEKENRRQERRAREAEEAAAKKAAEQRLEAQLREEKLTALRRQREKERIAAMEECEEGLDKKPTKNGLKERPAPTGPRNPEADAEVRVQSDRRSVVSSHPTVTPTRTPTTTSASLQPPARIRSGFRVVNGGGWRTWEAETKAELPVHPDIRQGILAEGSRQARHPGLSQVQTSSFPLPAASVPVPTTDGANYGFVNSSTGGWRKRTSSAASSKAPPKAQPSLTEDKGHPVGPERDAWRPRHTRDVVGPPASSQTTELPTSIWRRRLPNK
ncbi:hypothetical protein BU15DRAFT_76610 [Melanogaster broomeanus]|nr:hypothetical protein BU15DRAFT_76610 [Melanogaster broomeanus]